MFTSLTLVNLEKMQDNIRFRATVDLLFYLEEKRGDKREKIRASSNRCKYYSCEQKIAVFKITLLYDVFYRYFISRAKIDRAVQRMYLRYRHVSIVIRKETL